LFAPERPRDDDRRVTSDAQRLLTPRILWGAISVTPALFLFVLFMTRAQRPPVPAEPTMFYALGGVAAAVAVASLVLPRFLYKQGVGPTKSKVVEQVDERDAPGMFRQSAPMVRVFADPVAARSRAFGVYQTTFILGMALSEAVVLFGFVLGFLGFPLPHVLPFWGVGWLLMLTRFPTVGAVIGPFERLHDAQFL
jgi:hypothetical protein